MAREYPIEIDLGKCLRMHTKALFLLITMLLVRTPGAFLSLIEQALSMLNSNAFLKFTMQ